MNQLGNTAQSPENEPASAEELKGRGREDDYKLTKHYKKILVVCLYVAAIALLGMFGLFVYHLSLVMMEFFKGVLSSPEKTSKFVDSLVKVLSGVFATIAINYILQKMQNGTSK